MSHAIAPSILSANFARLGEEVRDVLTAGADLIHVDVMDNHYVPNLTIGPLVFKDLVTEFPETTFDVHLMCDPVDELLDEFVALGAQMVSFHPETCSNPREKLASLRQRGVKAGIALNPDVGLDVLDGLWDELDHVLVMSVKPGFGGQSFMPEVLPKVTEIKKKVQGDYPVIKIEMDGGMNENTVAMAAKAGVDIFVAGSAVFGESDYAHAVRRLRELAA